RARRRLSMAKAGQQGGEDVTANGVAGGDAQLHACLRSKSLELVRLIEQRQGARKELASRFIDAETARDPIEQRSIDGALKFRERGADGRLRHRKGVCGGDRAAVLGHRDEYGQLAQGQAEWALVHRMMSIDKLGNT